MVAGFTALALTAATSWGYVAVTRVALRPATQASPVGAGATGPARSTSPGPQDAQTAIAGIVTRWEQALAGGVEDDFVADVDPSHASFVTHWRSVFRGIRHAGLTGVTLVPQLDAMASQDRPSYQSASYLPVALSYTLPGWDPGRPSTTLGLTFAERQDRWYLVDDTEGDDALPLGGGNEPWLVGDVGVARRAHVLVIGDPARTADNEHLATSLERAVAAVRAAVPPDTWNGKVVAYAATDERFVSTWFGTRAATGRATGKEPATIAAEVRPWPGEAVVRVTQEWQPVTARITVTPFLLTRRDARADAVLRHEVTHVALALTGNALLPTWLIEGAAEYTAYRFVAGGAANGVASLNARGMPEQTWRDLRRGTWKPALGQTPGTFYSGTTDTVSDQYTGAWLTCLYLASHYGDAKLFALYLAAARLPHDLNAVDVEARALRTVLHTDRATLVRQVAAYARDLRRSFN